MQSAPPNTQVGKAVPDVCSSPVMNRTPGH